MFASVGPRRFILPALAALLALVVLGAYADGAGATSTGTALAFDYGATYRALVASSPPAGWEQPAFDDSAWPVLAAPFGNEDSLCGFPAYKTFWTDDSTVAARMRVSLPAGAHALHIVGTIDNNVTIWVNGIQVAYIESGNCEQGAIDIVVPDAALIPGSPNVIAALAEDTGVVTFFDIKATFDFTADDCKKGGWASLARADGSIFKNQGDCVSYTQNGK